MRNLFDTCTRRTVEATTAYRRRRLALLLPRARRRALLLPPPAAAAAAFLALACAALAASSSRRIGHSPLVQEAVSASMSLRRSAIPAATHLHARARSRSQCDLGARDASARAHDACTTRACTGTGMALGRREGALCVHVHTGGGRLRAW